MERVFLREGGSVPVRFGSHRLSLPLGQAEGLLWFGILRLA